MKKFITIGLVIIAGLMCTGCSKYIKATVMLPEGASESQAQVYYGAYNRRDNIWADVILYKKNSNDYCNGTFYINAPSRSITMKSDRVPAKMRLACSDGKVMDFNWMIRKSSFSDGYGKGFDQNNTYYYVSTINKSEFKSNMAGKRAVIPNKGFISQY